MLDVAWPELVVIGAVALVAIGPKDLPKAMRTLGRWAGRARGVAHELRRSFDQLAYESDVADRLSRDEPSSAPPESSASSPTDAAERERPPKP